MRLLLLLYLALLAPSLFAEGLTAERLGVVYNKNEPASEHIAHLYANARRVPPGNLVGLDIPDRPTLAREELKTLRGRLLEQLPTGVQSLLLVWTHPYAVECMSITTAFAAGYAPGFCEDRCGLTTRNPLFDSEGWLPADTVGWLPAMLLPSEDEVLVRALIERGIQADHVGRGGIAYLVHTHDSARNVRAVRYDETAALLGRRVGIKQIPDPPARDPTDVIAYFTGVAQVSELNRIHFRPGAVADHLTSAGGDLDGRQQMSALEWLRQGATGTYGTVTEPCNHLEKFPDPAIFLDHYLHGETLLEAYWKSVAMPGQGLFLGEPLARPFASP